MCLILARIQGTYFCFQKTSSAPSKSTSLPIEKDPLGEELSKTENGEHVIRNVKSSEIAKSLDESTEGVEQVEDIDDDADD